MVLGYDVNASGTRKKKHQLNSFLAVKKMWVSGTNKKVIVDDQEVLKKKKNIFQLSHSFPVHPFSYP